ncbi:hypothetical protein [Ligilactobacillus sp. LYQ60]|uniref:hypothetical protein n=1 Tax=Ligilactobacillus sp. LYQ60 TaxID=3378799 RepID=UPI003851E75F
MKQKAYVEGNKYFLGKITLESGERYNFISSQRFLFLVFPFLQWFMPIYCWKTADDVNQNSTIKWPLNVLVIFTCWAYLKGQGDTSLSFRIPPILSITAITLFGILFMKYLSHKYQVPRGVTLYKVRLYPSKEALSALPAFMIAVLLEVAALAFTITMPSDLAGPYLLVTATMAFFYVSHFTVMRLQHCQVEFLDNEESAGR